MKETIDHHVLCWQSITEPVLADGASFRMVEVPGVKIFVRLEHVVDVRPLLDHNNPTAAVQYVLVDGKPNYGYAEMWCTGLGEHRRVASLYRVEEPQFGNPINPAGYGRLRQLEALHSMTCAVLFGRRPTRHGWHAVFPEAS